MVEVIVDKEKLAHGLERGIGAANDIYESIPRKYRLRTTVCGIASTAIRDYTRREGIPSRLVASRPQLEFDPRMGHAMPLIGAEGDPDPTVIDASYSQFLSYAGLHWGYEVITGTKEFPPEKIMVFKLAQRALVINHLTERALEFQRKNMRPKDLGLGVSIELGKGPLDSADEATIRAAYSRIWSPIYFYPWRPSRTTADQARKISEHIPSGTITLS